MADTTDPPAPRKRGRPPKNKEGGATAKPVTLGPDGLPRKRGRPRKNPVVEVATTLDKGVDTAIADIPTTVPRKRGRPRKHPAEGSDSASAPAEPRKRGRPRKVPVQESDKEVGNTVAEPPKRRGRPPKRPVDEVTSPSNGTTADVPKKRGRPRKVAVEAEGAAEPKRGRGRPRKRPADETETPAQSNGASTDAPKKRGRPRKSDVNDAAAKTDKDVSAVPKRGRGRPRKSDAATNHPTKTANEKTTKQAAIGLRMKDIVGTYAIECEAAEDYRQDGDDEMELCISKEPEGYMAEFYLGCLEGVMLLAPDKASLHRFVESKSERTRKYAFSITDAESEEDEQPPRKKAKSSASPGLKSRRVLFKWRARETGEGQIHSNLYPGDNEGCLEFTDNKALKFVGSAGFPYMGENCKFTGTRVGEASELSMHWSDYSPKAAEEASRRRWE